MKNRKFWNWKNQADGSEPRVLELYGTIAEDSWFDDDVTPQMFRDELFSGTGDVVIWLNSPGGDCIAASQIYSMLMDYKGHVTVKIDGVAASAASVIAMAGTKVLMAPTALMMMECHRRIFHRTVGRNKESFHHGGYSNFRIPVYHMGGDFQYHRDGVEHHQIGNGNHLERHQHILYYSVDSYFHHGYNDCYFHFDLYHYGLEQHQDYGDHHCKRHLDGYNDSI